MKKIPEDLNCFRTIKTPQVVRKELVNKWHRHEARERSGSDLGVHRPSQGGQNDLLSQTLAVLTADHGARPRSQATVSRLFQCPEVDSRKKTCLTLSYLENSPRVAQLLFASPAIAFAVKREVEVSGGTRKEG